MAAAVLAVASEQPQVWICGPRAKAITARLDSLSLVYPARNRTGRRRAAEVMKRRHKILGARYPAHQTVDDLASTRISRSLFPFSRRLMQMATASPCPRRSHDEQRNFLPRIAAAHG